jgi:hypothetical protein
LNPSEGGEGLELKSILKPILMKKKVLGKNKSENIVEVVDFEALMDHLFMKHKIRCPPSDA